jgi:RNA polymerase sigma-70 factor (ECF subfamily)
VAFVLHDMFAVSFDDIATVLGRTPAATRQLASRARRKVQSHDAAERPQPSAERQVVEAFLAASRAGDFAALLAILDPDVVLRADATASRMGAAGLLGAQAVAERFSGQARAARPAVLDGEPGLVWTQHGQTKVAFDFLIENGRIVEIELVADEDRLATMQISY